MRILVYCVVLAASVSTPCFAQDHNTETTNKLRLAYKELAGNRPDTAAGILVPLVNAQPDNIEARRYLAHAFARSKNERQAIPHLNVIISSTQAQACDYTVLADCLMNLGSVRTASEYYSKALQLESDCPSAICGMAKIYIKQNEYEKAIAICETSLKRKANSYVQSYLRSLKNDVEKPTPPPEVDSRG